MQEKPIRLLHGKGSDLTNSKAIQRWAKCKVITQTTMLRLIDVAKEKGARDRMKAYWNTYHCQNLIYTANSRIYAPHCKNRFCTYCCGIRKAELINKYLPIVNSWKEPYFVTLTIKAVKANQLPENIKAIKRGFSKLIAKHRKKGQRNTGEKLIGLKSLECNFSPKFKTYNPHLHLIVPDKHSAETLITEWLTIWPKGYTHRDAQNYREVTNSEKDLIEVIKYEAKVFTEPDRRSRRGKKVSAKIYIRALDNIYAAMKGCRIIDRFGLKAAKVKKEKAGSRLTDDYQKWEYNLKYRDWLNEEHESPLTSYSPGFELETILESNIDIDLE